MHVCVLGMWACVHVCACVYMCVCIFAVSIFLAVSTCNEPCPVVIGTITSDALLLWEYNALFSSGLRHLSSIVVKMQA